jgi:hypothetical protein
MPSHADPREFAFTVETTFAEVQSDWTANGIPVYVIEPDAPLERAHLDNENIRPRRLFVHDYVHGLRSGSTMSWGHYLTAAGVSAAEATQAVATAESTIYHSALGGRTLGWSIGLAGTGTAAIPEVDADPGFVAGDWGFFYDTSGSTGEFRRIESIAAGPPVALTLLEALSFTPDDAADVLHAVIAVYPDEPALNDYSDPNHTTLGVLVQGEDIDDVYVGQGCKPAMSIEAITAGEPVKASIEAMVTTYPDAMPAKQTLTGTPSGIAPVVASIGTATTIRLGDFGGALAGVDCRGSVEVELAYAWDPVQGPCGTEGVKGYIGTGLGEAMVTITVAIDDDFDVDEFAETKKHLMIQVGDQPTNAIAIYWPRLEFAEKPVRVDEGGTTSMTLKFRAQEDTASIAGLTGDDIAQRRAPVIILMAA